MIRKWVLGERIGQKLLFHLLSKSEIQASACRIKTQKSILLHVWSLPCMMPPMHMFATAAHEFPLYALFLSHWSCPLEPLLQREWSRPSSIFSVTLATTFSSIWDVTSKRCSCHLSGLAWALQQQGRSHSPSPGDWRVFFPTPPFWNCWAFSFHTKTAKKIWPNYTYKKKKKSEINNIFWFFHDSEFISRYWDDWG